MSHLNFLWLRAVVERRSIALSDMQQVGNGQ
jgi:hypothetical protein